MVVAHSFWLQGKVNVAVYKNIIDKQVVPSLSTCANMQGNTFFCDIST